MKSAVVPMVRPEVKSKFFEGLSPAQIQEILGAGTMRRVFAKHIFTYPGDPAAHLYLLCAGRARHYVISAEGEKVVFQWLIRPGDIFSHAALLAEPTGRLAGVEIVESGFVIRWERERIRSLAAKYPKLWENVLESVFELMVRLVAHDMSLTGHTAPHRLRQALLDLAHGIGRTVREGTEIDVTNEDLASMAGVTMFTATRCLSEWRRRGVLAKKRGTILLRSPKRFTSIEI